MAGRSGRVNKREAALAALIEAPNLRAAAQACNVPERTLRRWMTESAFRQRYESMRGVSDTEQIDRMIRNFDEALLHPDRKDLKAASDFVKSLF